MSEILNQLICGENLEELAKLPKESVDLIYIDPPFFTHKKYEVVWGDEAEIRSFQDRWEGGIEHYISWLEPRVAAMYELLKRNGSFYLHCDWHANAHIRIMLDKVFGVKNFGNEIVWRYRRWPSKQKNFQRMHDNIFRYTKGSDCTWNQLYEEFSESSIKQWKGKLRVDVVSEEGRRHSETLTKKSPGPPMSDVWEISQLSAPWKEYLGYPTQKPKALLERIIQASSNKGDMVMDAFCGCGTACEAAQLLGRNWIGIDISPTAIKLVEKRLARLDCLKDRDYISTGSPRSIKELKRLDHFEFQNWVINEMRAKHSKKKVGDMGIDGYLDKDLYHEASGIQVKQSENVGRNIVDNFKSALDRAKYQKGYIVAFSFGKGAKEEAARLKNLGEADIELVTIEDLLAQKVVLGKV